MGRIKRLIKRLSGGGGMLSIAVSAGIVILAFLILSLGVVLRQVKDLELAEERISLLQDRTDELREDRAEANNDLRQLRADLVGAVGEVRSSKAELETAKKNLDSVAKERERLAESAKGAPAEVLASLNAENSRRLSEIKKLEEAYLDWQKNSKGKLAWFESYVTAERQAVTNYAAVLKATLAKSYPAKTSTADSVKPAAR